MTGRRGRVCVNIDGDLVQFAGKPTEADIAAWRELRAELVSKLGPILCAQQGCEAPATCRVNLATVQGVPRCDAHVQHPDMITEPEVVPL